MLVESEMTRVVVTVPPSCPVEAAAQLMHERRFRHLPVIADGRLVGIVSDRDLARRSDQSVGDVMAPAVISVTPDTPVEVAARLMLENKIGGLPVLAPPTQELVGIVTQSDIFSVFVRLLGVDRPTTRLELRLTDLSRQLAETINLAHHRGISIASLVTLPPPSADTGDHTVVLRVETMMPAPFVADLRAAGVDVVGPVEQLPRSAAYA